MVKEKLETVGVLPFKTCHRSFSLKNAVSLTSSHAAEPCCITMTQECPSVKEIFTEQQLTGGGEDKAEEEGRGKQKGTRLPLVMAHPQANRGKSITCRIKKKLVHKVKPSESCTHPCKHSLSSLPYFLPIAIPPPPLT